VNRLRKGITKTIQSRLFLLFAISMTGILLVVSILFYNRTTEDYQVKVSDLAKKNSSQTVALFDLQLTGYDSLSKSISNNMDVIRRLLSQKDVSPAVDIFNERSITNVIGAIYYSREDLMGIHVISTQGQGKVINYGDYANVIDPNYKDSDWMKRIEASSGEMIWLGVFPNSLIDTSLKQPVFAFGRLIYGLEEYKPTGIVLIEARPQLILSAMDNLRMGPHGDAFIVTDSNRIIASSEGAAQPPNLDMLVHHGQGAFGYDNALIVTSKIETADWTIVSRTPYRDLNVELVRTKRYLFVVFVILVGISVLIAIWGSRTISSPLRRIVREMRNVEGGQFNRVLTIDSYQEIGQLTESFNHMVARIAALIEQVKISSVSEKNAELQALQSQVNPHFLYNTLDMIYWLMDEKGNDQLAEIVLSLSYMFRYSSHWEDEVSLGEEVEQIRHYLNIIESRLQGRLVALIDIDERWLRVRVPKMTLQPIIENAVKHGLEPLGSLGTLRIHAEGEGNGLLITVSDNGVGMSAEQLEKLQQSLVSADSRSSRTGSTGGIGISNLQRRLTNMFGEKYGLSVESTPLRGTSVQIRLPITMEGREGL
jgi:two-component system, sensor histidine kinase YesM